MDIYETVEKRRLPSPEARRALRLAAGLRLQDVADAVGVTVGTAWYWEYGLHEPRLRNRERYAELLNLCREVGGE